MKPFRFRAASLLEWRRAEDERARRQLSSAEAAAHAERARAIDADRRVDDARRAYRDAMGADGAAEAVNRHRIWIARLEADARLAWQSEAQARRALEEAAAAAAIARRQLRVVERLRDRALRRHLDAVRRAEMKDLDQLATLQHARRIAEGGSEREC